MVLGEDVVWRKWRMKRRKKEKEKRKKKRKKEIYERVTCGPISVLPGHTDSSVVSGSTQT
jgi:hypothetical protein